MTTKNSPAVDFRRCSDGSQHTWQYKGKAAQSYVCLGCDQRVSKAALKEATDA